MDFFDVLKQRRSVRQFQAKPVTEGVVQKILAVAGSAPSAGNLQAYAIAVIRDRQKKLELAEICRGQDFIVEAPVVLIFAALPDRSAQEYGARGRDLYCVQDATIAGAYAQLACVWLGLGACWVGAFDENKLMRWLEMPAVRPVAVLPIGYPAETPEAMSRRKLGDLVYER